MSLKELKCCPSSLSEGHSTYSRTSLLKVFKGKKVHHILPYDSPTSNSEIDKLFEENRKQLSISGMQEKFSMLLDKNKLRLANTEEQGEYILKPIPNVGKRQDQMPANEHLTMQIAKQIYGIETAENALVFFKDGTPAYLTKRFDLKKDGIKIAQEDFASLAGRTPQTHGKHYKYLGNYLELFQLLKKYVPAYPLEAPKLLKRIIFNYLFSNGDAHFKNFSLIETAMGDFKLSPAYDLIHIEDSNFALNDGLLPKNIAQGKISQQLEILSEKAGISKVIYDELLSTMVINSIFVKKLTFLSFLNEKTKRNYFQSYQKRLKQLTK